MKDQRIIRFLFILLIGLGSVPATGQKPSEDSDPEGDVNEDARIAEALKLTTDSAERYSFALNKKDAKVELVPKPILRWSNPVAGSIHGNVFVWTHDGRPEVVASLFKWFSPFTHMSHEFHSLSTGGITATRDEKTVWQSQEAGVSFVAVPDASRPADSPARRQQQLRSMARQFTAQKTDRESVSRDLRLLTQPVFRYQSPKHGVLDGAMFVFVQGTDPEVWLLLEARRNGDAHQWQFAAARMNSVQFVVKHKDNEAWRVEIMPWSDVYRHRRPYTSFSDRRQKK